MPVLEILANAIAALCLAGMFVTVSRTYARLPAQCPIHFGIGGRPDKWGPRSCVWMLPMLSLALFVMMMALPFLGAKPGKQAPAGFLALVNAETMALMWAGVRSQLKVALGTANKLQGSFWLFFALLMVTCLCAVWIFPRS